MQQSQQPSTGEPVTLGRTCTANVTQQLHLKLRYADVSKLILVNGLERSHPARTRASLFWGKR